MDRVNEITEDTKKALEFARKHNFNMDAYCDLVSWNSVSTLLAAIEAERGINAEQKAMIAKLLSAIEERDKELQRWKDSRDGVLEQLQEYQDRAEKAEKAEETQRAKKEYYHEEHAKEMVARVKAEAWVRELERINSEMMDCWQPLADAVNRYRAAIEPIVELDRAFKGGHVDDFHIEQQTIDAIVESYNDLIAPRGEK